MNNQRSLKVLIQGASDSTGRELLKQLVEKEIHITLKGMFGTFHDFKVRDIPQED